MLHARRIVALTALLAAFGATAGALAGTLVAAAAILVEGLRTNWLDLPDFFLGSVAIGAVFGAPLGAFLLPVAGWALMRRVPLGRALAGTVLGTVVGGLAGWFSHALDNRLEASLVAGFAGFVVAVLLLRRSATRAGVAPAVPEDTGARAA